jgi:hypothetical protein
VYNNPVNFIDPNGTAISCPAHEPCHPPFPGQDDEVSDLLDCWVWCMSHCPPSDWAACFAECDEYYGE